MIGLVACAACQKPQTPEQDEARSRAESDSARTTFQGLMDSYSRHFDAGQADSMAAMYAEDAHVMPPNFPPVQGRDGVRQMYGGFFQKGPVGTLAFHVASVAVNGPLAVVRAEYVFTAPSGAPTPADTGEGVAHWHRVNGQWLIMEEIWRSNLPLPAPPPRPKS
jgi:uncharacterized protein (TIGR02246 family)